MQRLLLLVILTSAALAQTPDPTGVRNAALFPGADIGARINAAFADGGPGAHVILPAGQTFIYATTWRIPTPAINSAPLLDCQGSTLHYTGSGDAALVAAGGGEPYASGRIQNCILTGTPAAANGIHQQARVGMHFRDVTVSNFTNPRASALLVENTRFDGTSTPGGLGWSERLDADLNLFNDTAGVVLLGSRGGTNSYGYSSLSLRCQLFDAQWCLTIDGSAATQDVGADLYGSTVTLKANATFNTQPGGLLRVIHRGSLRTTLAIDAESQGKLPGFALFTDRSSAVQACGYSVAVHFENHNEGVSAQQLVSTNVGSCGSSAGATFQPYLFFGNVAQARSSKWFVTPAGVDYFMAAPGGVEPGSPFALWARNTADPGDPEADGPGRRTVLWADALSKSVGIGPGYETRRPAHTLEFDGTFANRAGTTGITAAGSLYQPLHTPATSHEPCTPGQFTDDPSFHYVCTAPNQWKRTALNSF